MEPIRVPTREYDDDDDDTGLMQNGVGHGIQKPVKVLELNNQNYCICGLVLLVILLVGMVIGEGIRRYPAVVGYVPNNATQPPAYVQIGGETGTSPSPGPSPTPGPSPKPEVVKPKETFPKEKLIAMRKSAEELVALLDGYYGSDLHILTDGWHNQPLGDGFANGHEYLKTTFMRALIDEEQKVFKIGTIGSSVAAGHDNCNYDSYEKQLARTWEGVWKAAGMELTVLNAGEGGGCGDSHENQVFCYKQNADHDVDIAHYSWTYFESNHRGKVQHEQLIRWSQMMVKQPPVHFLNVAGKKGECYDDSPNTAIFKAYEKFGANAFCLEKALYEGGKYGGKVWSQVGDGYHNTTRYGEKETNKERRDSLGVVFRNWHPGPLGFQTASDSFAYVYTKVLLEGLKDLEAILGKGEDPKDHYQLPPPRMVKDLPKPIVCDPTYCSIENFPGCLNFEDPTYGWHGAAIAEATADLNPYKGKTQGWKKWRNAQGSHNLIPKLEQRLYRGKEAKMCEHLDHCAGMRSSSSDDGWISFKLPKMEVGLVVICGCCGKKVGKSMFLDNPDLEVEYDGVKLDKKDWDIFPNAKCVRVLKKFPPNVEDKNGHAYLGVRLKNQKSKQVTISHLITI